jgi:hypothetical protein
MLARSAERANINTQIGRLSAWHRSGSTDPAWSRAAFSTDSLTWASADELAVLSAAVSATIDTWRRAIDAEDGTERRPVFVFAHGFPTAP